ncbi:hypothetical protein EST38_g1002 [Candolleomyces aberdarensis]|uniref:Uncharacterized protein n=1 Tax=Candolleomyces aberdarensis TaxID=2316362 RepID=A0A4Q2DWK4_9AGAR|nr:hypothetical protein EST38_g1002 [Candolleomyces aberdarensis]
MDHNHEVDSKSAPSSPTIDGAGTTALQGLPELGFQRPDPEEGSSTASGILPQDPYQFKDGIVPEDALDGLRNRKKGKSIVRYQQKQNVLIESLLKPMEAHTEDAEQEENANRLAVKIAIYASLYSNFALCGLQLYAAISSGSLSLLATAIDSVFDIGSNLLLWWLHRKAVSLDTSKWPVGFLMGTVNLIVVIEAIRSLATKEGDALEKFHLPSIISVGIALTVKFILFVYSFSIRKQSSQVLLLWEDHRNDLFINGFVGRVCVLSIIPGLDPTGAIIIGLGIIISWVRTVYDQFGLLAGRSAPHEFLQLLIYKVATFDEDILKVDTVRAYHSGPSYFVEIDIVMDADTPLWKAHDLSQQLQDKIEVLPNVERAFVHVDYETTHYPVRAASPLSSSSMLTEMSRNTGKPQRSPTDDLKYLQDILASNAQYNVTIFSTNANILVKP